MRLKKLFLIAFKDEILSLFHCVVANSFSSSSTNSGVITMASIATSSTISISKSNGDSCTCSSLTKGVSSSCNSLSLASTASHSLFVYYLRKPALYKINIENVTAMLINPPIFLLYVVSSPAFCSTFLFLQRLSTLIPYPSLTLLFDG